jgi:hypothetical protein
MRTYVLGILCFFLWAGALTTASGQSKVDLKKDEGGNYSVENGLPVPIVAFVVARGEKGNILSSASVNVPANGSQVVGQLPGYVVRIEDMEVIHLGVPRQKLPANFSRNLPPGVAQSNLAEMKDKLKELEISEMGVGGEKIALAAAQAQLWLEQRNDEKETFRNDPLRMELERQAAEFDTGYGGSMRRVQQRNERSRNQAIEDVADMAMAYSMAADAKLEVLQREKELYEPLYKNAKQALVFLREDMNNFSAEVQAGALFLNSAYQSLAKLVTQDASTRAGTVAVGGLRRLSEGQSGLKDLIEIQTTAPEAIAVLLAEAKFDEGGTQKTFFRRMGKSDRWVARIYWPLSARRIRFSIMNPLDGRPIKIDGVVQSGREPMSNSFRRAEKSMQAVIKKYKEISFRTEGADNIKTVPIP